jgi:hypothetical protein
MTDLGSQAFIYRDKAVLVKFSSNETGFSDVCKQKDRDRRKPYYAKFVPEGETQQRFLPGSSSATAWEAACKLAYYEATKEQLPAVIPNDKKHRTTEVCPLHVVGRTAPHCDARAPQEVQQEKADKKAKKAAELAAKLASKNVENVPVQPVFSVPTGLSSAPVWPAVPLGSPLPMQPMPSPLQPVPVALAPGGF